MQSIDSRENTIPKDNIALVKLPELAGMNGLTIDGANLMLYIR